MRLIPREYHRLNQTTSGLVHVVSFYCPNSLFDPNRLSTVKSVGLDQLRSTDKSWSLILGGRVKCQTHLLVKLLHKKMMGKNYTAGWLHSPLLNPWTSVKLPHSWTISWMKSTTRMPSGGDYIGINILRYTSSWRTRFMTSIFQCLKTSWPPIQNRTELQQISGRLDKTASRNQTFNKAFPRKANTSVNHFVKASHLTHYMVKHRSSETKINPSINSLQSS